MKFLIDYSLLCASIDDMGNSMDVVLRDVVERMPQDASPEMLQGVQFYCDQAVLRFAELKHMLYKAGGYRLEIPQPVVDLESQINALCSDVSQKLTAQIEAAVLDPDATEEDRDALIHATSSLTHAGAAAIHCLGHLATTMQRLEGRKPALRLIHTSPGVVQ